jgi:malate dehydrogenase (oxaloacetate-decarboxylating)
MDYNKESLKLHEEKKGKLEIKSKVKVENKDDLSTVYSPGVAEPCREIAKDKELAYKYTSKGNIVAVVSDGSAVLGLGNIGGIAGMPVMEGKAILFKEFAGVDAFPICLSTQDPKEIIQTVKNIAPGFGGINLEDIKAPECFIIEETLKKELEIPVFHDDQHGTAIVTMAALKNSCKLAKKEIKEVKIVINGAGAAGIAIANLLKNYGVKEIIMCDSTGIISSGRERMNHYKEKLALEINPSNKTGTLSDAVKNSDVFIGVSKAGLLTKEMVKTMNDKPIIFAMANPQPEIEPTDAKEAGVFIIGTGRSDYPNQINNVLAFPGIFRGALDARAKNITEKMKLAAADAIAKHLSQEELNVENILPSPLDKTVAKAVAEAVKKVNEE